MLKQSKVSSGEVKCSILFDSVLAFQDIHISFWFNFIRIDVLLGMNISACNMYENMFKCLNVKVYSGKVL